MTTKMPFAAALAAGVIMSASALAQQGPVGGPIGSPQGGLAVQPRDSRMGQPTMSEPDRPQYQREEMQQRSRTQTDQSQAQRQMKQEQTNRMQQASRPNQEQVRQVQQSLNERGFEAGPVDGIWGPQTAGAIQQFQQAQGMQPTGRFDAQTAEALGIQAGSQTSEHPNMQNTPRSQTPARPGAMPNRTQQSPGTGTSRGSSLPGTTAPAAPSSDVPSTSSHPSR